MVEVLSVPTHGSIRFLDNNTEIAKGQFLDLGNRTRFPIKYKPWSEAYFNTPGVTAGGVPLNLEPENVTFRLVGIDPMDRQLLTVSDAAIQPIYVVHANHRPTLVAPAQAIAAAQQQSSAFGARPKYYVNGVKLMDTADENIDQVRIDVWAFNGTLTLNANYRHLADFESCSARSYSPWQCFGSGDHNRNMTFLTEPSNVELVLSNLEYDAFYLDQSDEIVIQAFDGAGGQCLDPKELTVVVDAAHGNSFQTAQTECFAVQAIVSVPHMAPTPWAKMARNNKSHLAQAISLVLLGSFFICMCCTTSWCLNRCCGFKRATKDSHDDTAPSTTTIRTTNPFEWESYRV